jgi:GntR family transcriptional regulator
MILKDSKIPYYHQLYESLRERIRQGEWQPGDVVPTENELLEHFQISRSTVRQALDLLVQDGLIFRQRGRGTFVSHPTIEQALVRIISFTEDMQQRGMVPVTRVLISELIDAPEEIAIALSIEPGEKLAHLQRLRIADDQPMSIEDSYLVHQSCPGVLNGNYAQRPLRWTLEREYGIRLVSAKQMIRAIPAPAELAELLNIEEGDSLLYIERVSFSDQEEPIEFLRIYNRGDRYTLYSELRE